MENIGKFRSFRKSNNEQIHIPRKLTGVPGYVRTVGTDSNIGHPLVVLSVVQWGVVLVVVLVVVSMSVRIYLWLGCKLHRWSVQSLFKRNIDIGLGDGQGGEGGQEPSLMLDERECRQTEAGVILGTGCVHSET